MKWAWYKIPMVRWSNDMMKLPRDNRAPFVTLYIVIQRSTGR